MTNDQGYRPQSSRALGFGAALVINGIVITGLIFSAPAIMKKVPDVFFVPNTALTPEPPDIPPEPQPEAKETIVQKILPVAPEPIIPLPNSSIIPIETRPTIPLTPPIDLPIGPVVQIEPVKPLPAFLGAVPDPRYAAQFQPDYPTSELSLQRDGVVKVRILVGTDGRVKAVEQIEATSAAFFAVTQRQALAKWRFKPATRGGVPEESWRTMTVRFEFSNY